MCAEQTCETTSLAATSVCTKQLGAGQCKCESMQSKQERHDHRPLHARLRAQAALASATVELCCYNEVTAYYHVCCAKQAVVQQGNTIEPTTTTSDCTHGDA
jgi:hypothetical protein